MANEQRVLYGSSRFGTGGPLVIGPLEEPSRLVQGIYMGLIVYLPSDWYSGATGCDVPGRTSQPIQPWPRKGPGWRGSRPGPILNTANQKRPVCDHLVSCPVSSRNEPLSLPTIDVMALPCSF
jgi:hypothetical protein